MKVFGFPGQGAQQTAMGAEVFPAFPDLVAEADEYDRSFLRLTPVIAVVTNIDRDHLDTYGTLEAIEDAFVEFANRMTSTGSLHGSFESTERLLGATAALLNER